MKRPVLILLFLPFLYVLCEDPAEAQQLWRQRRWEASAGLGPSFFFGDVGGFSQGKNALGFKDLTWLQTRVSGNGSVRYRLEEDVNLRLSISAANLRATDERGTNPERDFQASMFIFEPAAIGEFYFIKNKSETSWLFNKGRGSALRRLITSLDFYAFTGLGAAFCSVSADEAAEARPEYSQTGSVITAVIPIGIGTTMIYAPDYNFGLELGGRYSFSDYIDGYSNPQYSKAHDVYYFLNFTFTYKIRTGQNGLPEFLNNLRRRRR